MVEKGENMSKIIFSGPHSGGGWQVKSSGAKRASSIHKTQAEAVRVGRQIAKNHQCEHKIQGRDGQIRQSNSYGNDPFPPRDMKH